MKSLIAFCFLLSAVNTDELEKVKITLFYESYCPYSIKFVREQLNGVVKELEKHIKLDLVPYGKATTTIEDGKYTFQCQHGEKECYGNKVHSCVLEQSKYKCKADTVETLSCLMHGKYTSNDVRKCCDKSKFSYDRLHRCLLNEASDLLAAYGNRTQTNDPKVTYVPMIIFNDHFDEKADEDATEDLKDTICKLFKTNVQACNEIVDKDVNISVTDIDEYLKKKNIPIVD